MYHIAAKLCGFPSVICNGYQIEYYKCSVDAEYKPDHCWAVRCFDSFSNILSFWRFVSSLFTHFNCKLYDRYIVLVASCNTTAYYTELTLSRCHILSAGSRYCHSKLQLLYSMPFSSQENFWYNILEYIFKSRVAFLVVKRLIWL